MPVIKSAKKKLRKDKKRTLQNRGVKNTLKALIKKAKLTKSQKAVTEAVSAADKAVKKHLIHKNKAARIKSSLSKLLPRKAHSTSSGQEESTTKAKPATTVKTTADKAEKKTAKKATKSSAKKVKKS